MNFYIGNTDHRWFRFLQERQPEDVNFWKSGGGSGFKAIRPGEPFEGYSQSLQKARLGQGSFRVMVTDAYYRRCSITVEKTLHTLEASHIKPYSRSGPHQVQNGILLRSDIHRLFDLGYLTITPDHHVEVSKRIKEEYNNGKEY